MSKTNDPTQSYIAAIRAKLIHTDLKSAEIELILKEHSELINELVLEGEDLAVQLGNPEEFANGVVEEFNSDRSKPAGRFAGFPFDFRGATSAKVRSRIWNPQDPRIIQPRLFGLGWTINVGALAVKCGWINQDSIDADVVAAIPPSAMTAAKVASCIFAAGTGLAMVTHWSKLPKKVYFNFTFTGLPRGRRHAKEFLLPVLPLSAALATAPYALATDREDALRLSAISAFLNAAALGAATSTAAQAYAIKRPGNLSVFSLAIGAITAVSVLVIPFRKGLSNVWHREITSLPS